MYEKGSNRSDRNELYFLISNYNNDSRGAEKFLRLFRPAVVFMLSRYFTVIASRSAFYCGAPPLRSGRQNNTVDP